jgi:hypothetical protein
VFLCSVCVVELVVERPRILLSSFTDIYPFKRQILIYYGTPTLLHAESSGGCQKGRPNDLLSECVL